MESQPQNPEFRNNAENFHPGFSLTFVFQESLGLPSIVFESPWANFKSPM